MKLSSFITLLAFLCFNFAWAQNNSIIIRVESISSDKPFEKIIFTHTPIDTAFLINETGIDFRNHVQGYLHYFYVLDSTTYNLMDSIFTRTSPARISKDASFLGYTSFDIYRNRKLIQRIRTTIPYETQAYLGLLVFTIRKNLHNKEIITGLENLICKLELKEYPCH